MQNEFFDKLTEASNYDFVNEFDISKENPLSRENYTNIANIFENNLTKSENSFLGGCAIFTSSGKQVVLVARNQQIADDFQSTHKVLKDMDIEVFFEGFGDSIQEGGLGHLKFDYFEMFFGKITEDFIFTIQVIDQTEGRIELINRQLDTLQNYFEKNMENNNGTSDQSKDDYQMKTSAPVPSLNDTTSDDDQVERENEGNHAVEMYSSKDTENNKPKKLMDKDDLKNSLAKDLENIDA